MQIELTMCQYDIVVRMLALHLKPLGSVTVLQWTL